MRTTTEELKGLLVSLKFYKTFVPALKTYLANSDQKEYHTLYWVLKNGADTKPMLKTPYPDLPEEVTDLFDGLIEWMLDTVSVPVDYELTALACDTLCCALVEAWEKQGNEDSRDPESRTTVPE